MNIEHKIQVTQQNMKLTQNKIDEIVFNILGKEGLRLVKELKKKDNISEFVLANKLKRDIKLIRHMLYKLHNNNLVSSTRKKDKQKGWYIYYWTLIPENIKFLYIKNKKLLLVKLKEQIKKEETEKFFTCPKKCVRLDFDQSLEFEFHCPECGDLISQDESSKAKELEKEISSLEKEIKEGERIVIKKVVVKEPKKKVVKKKAPKKKKIVKKKKVVKKKSVKKKAVTKKKSAKKKAPKKKKPITKKKVQKKSIKKKKK